MRMTSREQGREDLGEIRVHLLEGLHEIVLHALIDERDDATERTARSLHIGKLREQIVVAFVDLLVFASRIGVHRA